MCFFTKPSDPKKFSGHLTLAATHTMVTTGLYGGRCLKAGKGGGGGSIIDVECNALYTRMENMRNRSKVVAIQGWSPVRVLRMLH